MRAFILYTCLLLCSTVAAQKLREINPLLRDESFIATFGTPPNETTSEQLRIQTHLSYAEQLLRNVSTSELLPARQEKRLLILDLLHQYMQAGKFPVNQVYPGERRPCFIDEAGTICAVGYLIDQTKGHELAEAINAKHQYDFLADMNEPAIESWADEYGLTLEECAMIQPAYGYVGQTSADIKTGYGVSSGVIGGANIALNIIQLSNWAKHSRGLAYAGMFTGAGQIILGALNTRKPKATYDFGSTISISYKNQNNLSYINIAMGTATLITSVLNFTMTDKNKETRNAFNFYSYPNYNNSLTMGLAFSRRI